MSLNDVSVSTGQDITDLFGLLISSVYGPVNPTLTPEIPFFVNYSVDSNVIVLSHCNVIDGLGYLKSKYSYGPDGIPSIATNATNSCYLY